MLDIVSFMLSMLAFVVFFKMFLDFAFKLFGISMILSGLAFCFVGVYSEQPLEQPLV